VSASTLRNWRCRKLHPTLKFKKIGGRVIYTGSALLAYVNGN